MQNFKEEQDDSTGLFNTVGSFFLCFFFFSKKGSSLDSHR